MGHSRYSEETQTYQIPVYDDDDKFYIHFANDAIPVRFPNKAFSSCASCWMLIKPKVLVYTVLWQTSLWPRTVPTVQHGRLAILAVLTLNKSSYKSVLNYPVNSNNRQHLIPSSKNLSRHWN